MSTYDEEEQAIQLADARHRLSSPESLFVNPYLVILEEVTRTHAHVILLDAEVRNEDEAGGAHHTKRGQRTLSRWQAERRHLLDVSKTAISLGIAERQVKLAERQGELVAKVILELADELGLTVDQRRLLPRLIEAKAIELKSGAA